MTSSIRTDGNAVWQPIATAPKLDRVLVAGWQKPSGRTVGYWWWSEDFTDEHGKPMDKPDALYWHAGPDLSTLPATGERP
jgi:hypothetical protein